MKPETDYIAYLETKVCDQDYRIKELEATLMLVAFSQANKVNRDLIYLLISKRVYEAMPFSHETIKRYKELLHDCKSPQI
jgi:hypothetical protein